MSWQPPGVANKPNAAGVINDEHFDVRIFDDDDHELRRGTEGEIVIRPLRPHTMFEGYWGRPEATVEASRNWWYHTGDMGRIDEDGYLFFVDRKADYLRRRGENISSFEVERVLMSHGALADVAVHAVPSPLTEDDLKVTATVKEGAAVTEEELFRWCVDQLPYFALPRYIEFRAELPRSPVGRVLKRDLRAEGVTAVHLGRRGRRHHLRAAVASGHGQGLLDQHVPLDQRPGQAGRLPGAGRAVHAAAAEGALRWPGGMPARVFESGLMERTTLVEFDSVEQAVRPAHRVPPTRRPCRRSATGPSRTCGSSRRADGCAGDQACRLRVSHRLTMPPRAGRRTGLRRRRSGPCGRTRCTASPRRGAAGRSRGG